MRCALTAAVLLILLAGPATAQTPAPQEPGARRFTPPPDHWMTLDSLAAAVELTAAQRSTVAEPYTALNGVMRDAAARRREIRAAMQGRMQSGQPPSAEMRTRMDSVRAEMEGFQAEADQWLVAIRGLLTPAQQARFDALPKPQLVPRGPMRGGNGDR